MLSCDPLMSSSLLSVFVGLFGLFSLASHIFSRASFGLIRRRSLTTGANTDLGFEAASEYVALGATSLLLNVRSIEKGDEINAKIVQPTGIDTSVISALQVNLDDFSKLHNFVQWLDNLAENVDVARLNIGVGLSSYKKSEEGRELAVRTPT